MLQTKLQQFEGPLDLLLSLIEQQKLNITEIAIAEVTEQFLKYIKELEELDPTLLADYLHIAAKLLVIKSKAILPTLEVETEEEDAGLDLTEKLLLYKQFREVAKYLAKLDARRKQSFVRMLQFEERIHFFPDTSLQTGDLHKSILRVLNGLKELDNLPKAKIKEVVSIQEKIDHIQKLLTKQIETKLSTVLQSAKNKSEVIITFLALLELTKQKILTVEQEALFADITIKKFNKEHMSTNEEEQNTSAEEEDTIKEDNQSDEDKSKSNNTDDDFDEDDNEDDEDEDDED